jgi:peptidoglycan/xylan/chitin deacetylase (PgdA/CDA1 family)
MFRERSFKDWSKHKAAQIGAALTRACGTRIDDSLGVFMYHRISHPIRGTPAPTLNVAPDRFREQIAGLQRRGYVIRPLAEVLRTQRLGLPMPPRTVVLTFDDGFASVYKNAWPVLMELQAPATVFLCTAFLDSETPFPFDPWAETFRKQVPVDSWRPLRTDECREMLASGLIEFGAHTHTHQDFRSRPDDLADDLRTCQQILGDKFGQAEFSFAFPFGYYDDALIDVVRGADLTCALTVDDCLVRHQANPFGWGRFMAYDWDTSATLAAKREGWYTWLLDRYQNCRRMVRGIARWPPQELPPRMQTSPRTNRADCCLR